jgi:hypothetical protein
LSVPLDIDVVLDFLDAYYSSIIIQLGMLARSRTRYTWVESAILLDTADIDRRPSNLITPNHIPLRRASYLRTISSSIHHLIHLNVYSASFTSSHTIPSPTQHDDDVDQHVVVPDHRFFPPSIRNASTSFIPFLPPIRRFSIPVFLPYQDTIVHQAHLHRSQHITSSTSTTQDRTDHSQDISAGPQRTAGGLRVGRMSSSWDRRGRDRDESGNALLLSERYGILFTSNHASFAPCGRASSMPVRRVVEVFIKLRPLRSPSCLNVASRYTCSVKTISLVARCSTL